MQTTEIRMITDLDSAVPQSLDFNFEEVKDWLAENLTAYRSMVVTEDALGAAKADKAKIRKISSAISEQRIAVKKRYLEPYNSFEAKMKELSAMCDEAAKNIDTQVKAFEEAQAASENKPPRRRRQAAEAPTETQAAEPTTPPRRQRKSTETQAVGEEAGTPVATNERALVNALDTMFDDDDE